MMRRLASFATIAVVICQSGCQNFGGYPMQSVTRVPPPATGSYPLNGSYYTAPGSSQSSIAPASGSTSHLAGNNAHTNPLENSTVHPSALQDSFVSQAQYTGSPNSTSPGSTVPNSTTPSTAAPITVPQQPVIQQQSNGPSMPKLQWQ